MKDPTKKSEWVLSHCAGCHALVNFWRIKDRLFRCMACGSEKEIPEFDHDRDGLLES